MMSNLNLQISAWQLLRNSIFLVAMLMLNGTAMADRPDWAGRGDDGDGENSHKHKHKHDRDREDDRDDDDRRESRSQDRYQARQGSVEITIGGYFGDTQRSEAHEYYRERSRHGHCPPGLAKKHNGCVPPGQDRQWTIGESLPRDVVYQPIDPVIKVKLGMPPEGHKFVRVASDILLIAVGSGMVVDAIQNLGQ